MKPKCGGREGRGGLDECERRPKHRDSLGFIVGRGSAAEADEGQQGRSTTHGNADLTHRDHHSVLVFRRSERRNAPTACETPRRTVSSGSATSSHGARQAQRRLGLGEQGWSARPTRGESLGQEHSIRAERSVTGHGEQMRRVNGGHHVHPGRRTHPGTNAGSMHAGIVMCRMLEFMRDRTPGRHCQ